LETAVGLAVEVHPQLVSQVKDVLGPLADAHVHYVEVAQAIAYPQRVLNVLLRCVTRTQHRSHPTLSLVGVGVREGTLGHNQHATVLGGTQSEVEACQARAKNEVVSFHDDPNLPDRQVPRYSRDIRRRDAA
jgi:hypothetical protein